MQTLRLVRDILAHEKELKKARKRLELAELDYGALQTMVNEAISKNVKIEIRNGTNIITIVPMEEGKINFRSFKDRYENIHHGG